MYLLKTTFNKLNLTHLKYVYFGGVALTYSFFSYRDTTNFVNAKESNNYIELARLYGLKMSEIEHLKKSRIGSVAFIGSIDHFAVNIAIALSWPVLLPLCAIPVAVIKTNSK